MRSNHNDRLFDRNQQTVGWAAPLPDFSMIPRASEPNIIRMEWDTRNTMNNRYYEQTQNMGPTAVTAAMLQDHPTHGAEPFMPSTGRQDQRPYQATATPAFFPDTMDPVQRPRLPPRSVWQHPYLNDVNQEDPNLTREFRTSVTEENRGRHEDISVRSASRTFQHQWGPQLSLDQLAAAERLRPRSDDYRVSYAHLMDPEQESAAPGSLGGPGGGDLREDPNAARLYPTVLAHDRLNPGSRPDGIATAGSLTQPTGSRMFSSQ